MGLVPTEKAGAGHTAGVRALCVVALLTALAPLGLFGAGCRAGPSARAACERDSDCAEGLRCLVDADGAFCACDADSVCGELALCNSASRCQRKPRCRVNQDCASGLFCDLGSGLCEPMGSCRADVHCPAGSVCLEARSECAAGCYADGHCPQYQICDLAQADLHPDRLGECVPGCREHKGCALGARCVGGRCYDSPNPSHCAPCSGGLSCPYPSDWCLINPTHDAARPETGGAYQCAVDCEGRDEICPNGYVCADVVRLTADPCQTKSDCPGTRACVVGEGEAGGFCGCASNDDCSYRFVPPTCTLLGCLYPPGRLCGQASDCGQVERCADHDNLGYKVCYRSRQTVCDTFEDCLCVSGACVRSGRACSSGADCNPTCEEGRCRIGQACSPEEGLFCPNLR